MITCDALVEFGDGVTLLSFVQRAGVDGLFGETSGVAGRHVFHDADAELIVIVPVVDLHDRAGALNHGQSEILRQTRCFG